MRFILKTLRKVVSGLSLLAMVTLMLMPATTSERAALGADPARFDVIQKRLASVMLTVAPDFFIARYAQATDMPEHIIRAHLEAKASGEVIALAPAPPTTAPNVTGRRTEAGGAVFVTTD